MAALSTATAASGTGDGGWAASGASGAWLAAIAGCAAEPDGSLDATLSLAPLAAAAGARYCAAATALAAAAALARGEARLRGDPPPPLAALRAVRGLGLAPVPVRCRKLSSGSFGSAAGALGCASAVAAAAAGMAGAGGAAAAGSAGTTGGAAGCKAAGCGSAAATLGAAGCGTGSGTSRLEGETKHTAGSNGGGGGAANNSAGTGETARRSSEARAADAALLSADVGRFAASAASSARCACSACICSQAAATAADTSVLGPAPGVALIGRSPAPASAAVTAAGAASTVVRLAATSSGAPSASANSTDWEAAGPAPGDASSSVCSPTPTMPSGSCSTPGTGEEMRLASWPALKVTVACFLPGAAGAAPSRPLPSAGRTAAAEAAREGCWEAGAEEARLLDTDSSSLSGSCNSNRYAVGNVSANYSEIEVVMGRCWSLMRV